MPQENNYVDSKGNKLERGFYKSHGSNNLIYCNGYGSDGVPDIKRENENGFESEAFNSQLTKRLYKIDNEEVEKILDRFKAKASWLEERLK
jgi:hypothetical protein